jgi:hypothetical protein
VVRLASPSTSFIVISEYPNVESRHFTQTLGIPEFYIFSGLLSLSLSRKWTYYPAATPGALYACS